MDRYALAFIALISTAFATTSDAFQDASKPTTKAPSERKDPANVLREEEPRISERSERIKRELSELGDRSQLADTDWAKEWAGEYYVGDGLGMNVRLLVAPKNGITYTWHGCLGLYDGNHGDIVESTPNYLRVKFTLPPEDSTYDMVSEKLFFVKWSDRRYLAPEAKMPTLIDDFNRGGFARQSLYSTPRRQFSSGRPEDRMQTPPGFPELPEPYASAYTKQAIPLRIAKVDETTSRFSQTAPGRDAERHWHIYFDRGSRDGITEGMHIATSMHPELDGFPYIDIVDVTPTTSKGTLSCFWNPNDGLKPPTLGDTFNILLLRPRPVDAEVEKAASPKEVESLPKPK